MKGDDRRAAALARFLDGGPLDDEIEAFEPAVRALRAVLDGLQPDPDAVRAVCDYVEAAPLRSAPTLASVVIPVADMTAAVEFYRDALGLEAVAIGARSSTFRAGAATLRLELTTRPSPGPRDSTVTLHLRVTDLTAAIGALRERGIIVSPRPTQALGPHAELRDPDGTPILLLERSGS